MKDYGKLMAESIIKRKMDFTKWWGYEYGLTLDGIAEVWKETNDSKYLDFIKDTIDTFIYEDGSIRTYSIEEYNIDNLNNGKILITLFKETQDERYKKALGLLEKQINSHPRSSLGIFCHKKKHDKELWLDGLYMGATFYAKYLNEFGGKEEQYNDIAYQFIKVYELLKDEETGLLHHGYDEEKKAYWADKGTGLSCNFWGRAMGWYMMAIVDTLEVIPKNNKFRDKLIEILNNCINALIKYADKETNLWYQVLEQGNRKGNYLEASASSMITYAMLKGTRLGYLDNEKKKFALKSFNSMIDEFILECYDGTINLNKICFVAGPGGKDAYTQYIGMPIVSNEPKGLGPFIMAAVEYNKA